MEKKITKKEYFGMLVNIVKASDSKDKDDLLNFIGHELELLENKSNRLKESATKATHQPIMNAIKEVLSEKKEPINIADLLKDNRLSTYKEGEEVKEMSNQKLSSMLKRLVDAGEVERKVIKRKSYFELVK